MTLAAVLTAIIFVGVALCDSPDTACCKGCRRIAEHATARRLKAAAEARHVKAQGPYR